MNHAPLSKIQAATAAEVCANFDLARDAKQLLRHGMSPQDFVAALVEKVNYVSAIEFMAHALPMREGIWWGCLCMQHALGDHLAPPDRAAAAAAVMWVMQPTEENRAAAQASGEAADPLSPAGALATAVSQTGGSTSSPRLLRMPPPPAPADSIARAVTLASIKTEPANILKMQRCYVELALQVAQGTLI
jgi:hypothetical protein